MNKKLKTFICAAIFSVSIFQCKVLAANDLVDSTVKVNIDTNKEWSVKFNSPLNPETVNNKNIVVTDSTDKVVPVTISLGSNGSTVIISSRVSGYEPNKKYNLSISTDIQSTSGKRLSSPLKMQFTTVNKYSDGTVYEGLPQITSVKFDYTPLLPEQKQGFNLITSNGDKVQYRVFVHSYADDKEVYSELTDGYTTATDGKVTAVKALKTPTSIQKYKAVIYVKRADVAGAHKDMNTDYDNCYVDYFTCANSINTDNNVSVTYDNTLNEMVDIQKNLKDKSVFLEYSDPNNEATRNQIKYYMNPNNFMDNYGKYQFLKLTYIEGITAEDLDNVLKGKGILEGKGQAFLDAAKANNINPAYLVSHALLETGNGTSLLANGGLKDANGKYQYEVPVYNFFGIGAIDKNANYYGTKTAYDNKWFTPEEAIMGGAKWISPRYINNETSKQDTLYKMRWNPVNPGEHQYATDISWAYKQISRLKDIMSKLKSPVLIFEIPQFK